MERLVSDIMSSPVITIEQWESLLDVAQDMKRHHLRHLPVVDGSRLVGLVSHRDLLACSVSRLSTSPDREERDRLEKRNTFVGDVMTRHIETIRATDTIAHAARKLLVGRFGCLPVVDEEQELVGIVTEIDLLRVLAGGDGPRGARAVDPHVARGSQ